MQIKPGDWAQETALGKKAPSDYRVLRKCVARVFAERLETAIQEVAHVVGEVCVDHLRKIECMLIDKRRRNKMRRLLALVTARD